MRRAHSPGSDVSDADADRQAENEQEYMNLRLQYRLLERDRNIYMQESQELIKRQRAEIDQLENEYKELETNSRLIQSDANIKRNNKQLKELEYLGQLKNDCEKEIEEEKKKQQGLDAQIRELEKEEQKRSGNGGKSGGGRGGNKGNNKGDGKHNRKATEKDGIGSGSNENRKLENQLQLSNNKFGKLLEGNRVLREEIDNLRVERQKFEELHQKLLQEKESLKQKTNVIIEQSTQAYEQRVETQEKMVGLREKNDKDIQQHNAEVKELRRVIDHDNKLQEFMSTKGAERGEDGQLVEWRERKEYMERERKKASQTDSVESYELAYEEIKQITQKDDLNIIVSQFVEGEAENFALLNLVNEQNNTIENLQEDIDKLYRDIDALMKQGSELELSRAHILKRLEEHQTVCKTDVEKYNEKCKELKKVLDEVKSGVGLLFVKISCDRSSIDQSLGSEDSVTDGNIMEHLGIIEERTNQLLLMQAFVTKQKDIEEFVRKQTTLLGNGPLPRNQLQLQTVPAPAYHGDSDGERDVDVDSWPLSRDSLEEIARQAVLKLERIHQGDSISGADRKPQVRHERVKSSKVL